MVTKPWMPQPARGERNPDDHGVGWWVLVLFPDILVGRGVAKDLHYGMAPKVVRPGNSL
jgi:hypothetical protein